MKCKLMELASVSAENRTCSYFNFMRVRGYRRNPLGLATAK